MLPPHPTQQYSFLNKNTVDENISEPKMRKQILVLYFNILVVFSSAPCKLITLYFCFGYLYWFMASLLYCTNIVIVGRAITNKEKMPKTDKKKNRSDINC